MVEHHTPAMASITGSVRAGMQVAESASKDLKRVHLELGGKAPVVVFEDADIAKAVEDISVAGFFNAGPGLYGRHARARPRVHPRRVRDRARQGRRRHEDRAAGRRGRAVRPAQQRQPARSRSPASSSGCPRTPRSRPAATGSARRATSTPRPSSPASSRTTRSSRTRSSARSSPSSPSPTRTQAVEYANGVDYALASSVWTKDHGARDADVQGPRLRLRVDQHPHPAGRRDAARRLQEVRLRQGPVGVRLRGLHADQARDDVAGR